MGHPRCCRLCVRFTHAVARLLLLFLLAVAGGLLYRVRGGWGDWSDIDAAFGGSVLTHDMFGRLFAWALPTALLLLALSRNVCAGTVVAASAVVLLYFGIMVGWGTYFSLGHEEWKNNSLGRPGAFDWLVGPRFPGANESTRFLRDFNGMTFRGLQQSVPTGFVLLLYGYGWLPMASGSVLGIVYDAGYYVDWKCLPANSNASKYIQDNFSGTAMAEFITGFWTWLVLSTVLLAHREVPDLGLHRMSHPGREFSAETSSCASCCCRNVLLVVFHVTVVIFEALLGASCVSYAMVQQDDMRNRNQTLLGLIVSLVGTIAIHIACCVGWSRFKLHANSTRTNSGQDQQGNGVHDIHDGRSTDVGSVGQQYSTRRRDPDQTNSNGGARSRGGVLEEYNYGDGLNAPLLETAGEVGQSTSAGRVQRTLSEEFAPTVVHDLSDVLSPAFTKPGHEDDTFTATFPGGAQQRTHRGCGIKKCCGLWCRCCGDAGKPPVVEEVTRVVRASTWMGVDWTLERGDRNVSFRDETPRGFGNENGFSFGRMENEEDGVLEPSTRRFSCGATLRDCCGGCPVRSINDADDAEDHIAPEATSGSVPCTLSVLLALFKVISLVCLVCFVGTLVYGVTTCSHPFGNWTGSSG